MTKRLKFNNVGVVKSLFLIIVFSLLFTEPIPAQSFKSKYIHNESLTLGFIENKGQIIDQHNKPNPDVRYLLNMPGMNVQLKSNGFSYDAYIIKTQKKAKHPSNFSGHLLDEDSFEMSSVFHRIDIEFIGSNASPELLAENPGDDYLNYYTSSLAESGATFVHHFGKVIYKNLYQGIDLEFIARPGTRKPVEYNFIVHPGADMSLIQWRYYGSNDIKLYNGSMHIKTMHGVINEFIPVSYELESNNSIKISYKALEGGIFSFEGKYNNQKTIIIDPIPNIIWATYYGSTKRDKVNGVSFDSSGNVYLTGETTSNNNMATSGSHQTTYAGGTAHYNWGGDAFVAKLNQSGSRVWSTYYGGSDNDQGNSIITTINGDSYVAGCSESTSGIATSGAFQTTRSSSTYHNAMLVKFNTSGTRQWGTYYASGGNDHTSLNSITFDTSGNVLITGSANCVTNCKTITTSGAYQTQNSATGTGNAYNDAYVAKFSPSGSLIWGTYFGGNRGNNQASHDQGAAIYVDDSNYVYLTGYCQSSVGIATTGAHQTSFGGSVGTYDAYIAKFNSTGTALMWATYYGGSGNDYGRGIVVDDSGNVYVSGTAASTTTFTTSGAFQSTYAGGAYDGYLAKFNRTGTRQWGTYYGGSGSDLISKLSLNPSGDLIITGYIDSISSTSGLATSGAYQTTYGGGTQDGMIVKFSTSGARKWCSYYGGNLQDLIYNHSVDPNGNIYIGGLTFSTSGIATSGTYQTSWSAMEDGFVAKVQDQPILVSSVTSIQPDTTATPAGTQNKMIIGVKINTTGYNAFAKVTQFSFDTAGAFDYSNITGPAKVYYTGNADTFNALNLFDSTSSKPTAAFTVSGNQVLDTGTVYFWLAFDVDFNATANDYLDAKCTEMKWDSGGTSISQTPVEISPGGKIRITPPLKKLGSIHFTQPSTYYVYRYSIDNPVLRIDLNVLGTAGTLLLNQLTVGAVNTNNSDVSYVKLYYTTSTTFSTSNMIGSAVTISGGIAGFTSLNHSLPAGKSYIWVTYDIPGSASIFDTVDAKIPANGIVIGGESYPSSDENPSGERIIYSNFQYDAGISNVLSPSAPYCKTSQFIKARLYNYGTSTLTSDTVRWAINGVAQSPYIWTGSLATGNYTDLSLGSYNFTMGTNYTIKVYPSYINGTYQDSYHPNDTATLTFTIYPTPVASFSVNDTFQCFKGNSFVFTNTSAIGYGTFTSSWNFGDASFSSSESPTHSYQGINTYPVQLIVTSAYGCSDSISHHVSLKPNQITAFSMNDTVICLNGNTFDFTNNTTFGYGTFTNFWKFGDNATSTAISPSHSYNSIGTYEVKLITTTNTGCVDSLSKTVYVNEHPVSSFQIVTDTSQCLSTNLYTFTNSTTIGSGTFTNLWRFGDNTSSTSSSPVKSYTSTGSYTIKLINTSNHGCKDSVMRNVIVHPNPVTSFGINDSSQCTNTNSYVFTNNSSIASGTFSSLWNFGDQSTSSNTSPSKTYTSSGIYDVKLVTESNYGCKDSVTQKAYLRPNTGIYFTINDSDQCFDLHSFTFSNFSNIISGSFTNLWTFGDNTSSSTKSPSKMYSGRGTYSVKLLTTSNFGCKDSLTRKVYVRPHPVSSFTINDSSQCANLNSFIFTNFSSIPSGTFSNSWEFGDLNTSTLSSPVHTYTSQGTFNVKLTTTSNHGCKDISTRKVIISPRPFAYFTTSMSAQCLSSNLFYLDNHSSVSPGTIAHSYWTFGDGDSSELYSPQHKYTSAGTYTIMLKVESDFGCTDTISRKVEVVPAPEAGMILSDTALCFQDNLFQFTDDSKSSIGTITNYYWFFGDGKFSTSQNSSHSYASSKSFVVTHIVTSSNGCKDTVTQTLLVHPMPEALFTINENVQCQVGNSFVLNNQSSPAGLDYQWAFGDGENSTDASPSYSYSSKGIYDIRLISVTAENCPDTLVKSVTVKESPIIKLGNDTTLYHNQSITLDAGGVYDSYLWSTNETSRSIEVNTNDIGLDNPTLFWVQADLQGCEGHDSISITFTHNISIQENNVDLHLVVYPNPTSEFIYIESDRIVQDMSITLTDLNGKILLSEPFRGKNQHRIDMRELAKGIYYLNFSSKEITKVMKVIKY